ncbi:MAG: VOC family protein, partial [Rickettsiales bacterium]
MSDLSLDHVGFMVRDLDAGAERWRKLGFLLSRRSPQMGKVPGVADMAPWATSNHCVMFEYGYLELIGVTNPENFNPWTRFLDRFEGAHITALRCREADAAYASLSERIEHFDQPL